MATGLMCLLILSVMKVEIQYFYYKKNNLHLSINFVKVKARSRVLHYFHLFS